MATEGVFPKINGDILYGSEVNKLIKFVGTDLTLGTVSGTTTETLIGQVTISANTLSSSSTSPGLLVMVSIVAENLQGVTTTHTFRIRAGTAGTTADALQTSNIIYGQGTATERHVIGGSMFYFVTGLTWTSVNYISVTGEMNAADANSTAKCVHLVVLGVTNS